jgi:hypothetical protein
MFMRMLLGAGGVFERIGRDVPRPALQTDRFASDLAASTQVFQFVAKLRIAARA